MAKNDLQQELDRLRAENEALKKSQSRSVSLKVSDKGGLSVYGIGRFPVTLYREQWETVLSHAEEITSFIAANDGKLKRKGE